MTKTRPRWWRRRTTRKKEMRESRTTGARDAYRCISGPRYVFLYGIYSPTNMYLSSYKDQHHIYRNITTYPPSPFFFVFYIITTMRVTSATPTKWATLFWPVIHFFSSILFFYSLLIISDRFFIMMTKRHRNHLWQLPSLYPPQLLDTPNNLQAAKPQGRNDGLALGRSRFIIYYYYFIIIISYF